MDTFGLLNVSASALYAQRERMNTISSNMANAHTTRTQEGGPYRRREVVFEAMPIEGGNDAGMTGVKVSGVVEDGTSQFTKVYDPGHPDADSEGNVSLPNVNIVEEMADMMMTVRAYEANVSAFNMSKAMFLKALEIGRS